jgi:hypothetical protein
MQSLGMLVEANAGRCPEQSQACRCCVPGNGARPGVCVCVLGSHKRLVINMAERIRRVLFPDLPTEVIRNM